MFKHTLLNIRTTIKNSLLPFSINDHSPQEIYVVKHTQKHTQIEVRVYKILLLLMIIMVMMLLLIMMMSTSFTKYGINSPQGRRNIVHHCNLHFSIVDNRRDRTPSHTFIFKILVKR